MLRIKAFLTIVQAIILLLLAVFFLFLFLASGHEVNLKDYAQGKLIIEIFLFAVTSVVLFSKIRDSFFWSIFLIILMLLVQLAFVDICIELLKVKYENGKEIMLLSFGSIVFINNIYLIYLKIKAINKTT